jgi:hypothetical protein
MSLEKLHHGVKTKNGEYSAQMEVISCQPAHPDPDLEKLRVLISFGEHAREFISSETGLHVLQVLAEPSQLARQLQGNFTRKEVQQIQHLLDCCVHVMVCTSV